MAHFTTNDGDGQQLSGAFAQSARHERGERESKATRQLPFRYVAKEDLRRPRYERTRQDFKYMVPRRQSTSHRRTPADTFQYVEQIAIQPRTGNTREAVVETRPAAIETIEAIEAPTNRNITYTQSPPALSDRSRSEARSRSRGRGRRYSSDGEEDNDVPHRHVDNSWRAQGATFSPYRGDGNRDEPGYIVDRYQMEDAEREEMGVFDNFCFVKPARAATGVSSPDEDEASDLESSHVDASVAGKPDGSIRTRATRIYSSHYAGSAELGGSHAALLRELHDPQGKRQPLFRWLHIQQNVMSFESFWAEISRQSGFSESIKVALGKLRADVQRTCVKSRQNPKGSKVGYMDPKTVEVPLPVNKKTPADASAALESVKWICIPYFVLQRYSGLLSASNTATFPSQTLLQAQYSRSTQQRDMEQAVCQLGGAGKDECFHIAQLWCVMIGNSWLVTCGTMQQKELGHDTVTVSSEPSPAQTSTTRSGTILVTLGSQTTWSFSTEECSTWMAFMSHFDDFWPLNLEFKHRRLVVTAENWGKILRLAGGPRESVTLTLQVVSKPEPLPRGVLQPATSPDASPAQRNENKTPHPKSLHVLQLWQNSRGSASARKKEKSSLLKEQLAAADHFMLKQTPFSVREAYSNCRTENRETVLTYLQGQTARDFDDWSAAGRRAYEDRIDVFNAADVLFQLFLPVDCDNATASKFWGAVYNLVQISRAETDDIVMVEPVDVTEIREGLRTLSQDILQFQAIFAAASEEERGEMELPPKFVTAWLRTLSGLICAASGRGTWSMHLAKASSLIYDGMDEMVRDMQGGDLLSKAVMMPADVFSLIAMDLLQDQVGKSDDVAETYSQYLNALDTDITTKPSDRSYQHRIDLVQQEMTAVKRTLAKQRYIVNSIKQSFDRGDGDDRNRRTVADNGPRTAQRERSRPLDNYYYDDAATVAAAPPGRFGSEYGEVDDGFPNEIASAAKLSPTDTAGFRGLFLAECARVVEQREFEFRRHSEYAADLERAIAYKMDWTKDRQENAIYAFTLVTIVFLPLSSVASIFGMNTTDVRDMPFSQWVYWAVALPVTAAVILGGLWWMDELGNIVGWMAGRQARRSSPVYPTAAVMAAPQGTQEGGYYTSPAAATAATKTGRYGDGGAAQPVAEVVEAPVETRMGRAYGKYAQVETRMRQRRRPVYRY